MSTVQQVNRIPLIGEKAPDFEATTSKGKIHFPSDYNGKWVILFSHPGDFTPVCTTEFVGFQERIKDFKELNTDLVGLSVDQVFSHIKWVEWIKDNLDVSIEFPIIADDMGLISQKYGMIHEKKGNNSVRAVFLIDPNGIIRAILYYPQEIGRNIDEIVRMLRAFQTHEKHKVAIPANWPNNTFLGSKVILPPPTNQALADERKKKIANKELEGYDWWLVTQEITN